MRIVCIGDSLTEGDYGIFGMTGIGNVKAENYPYFLGKELSCEVINAGKCGYTSSTYLEYYEQGNVEVNGADIIIVMLGTNGGQHPTKETQGNKDYCKLLAHLKEDAPNAKVVLCTPPHTTSDPAYSNCGFAPQVKDAVGFVRDLAAKEDYPLIDTAEFEEFCAETEAVMQPNDGLHFGLVGYKTLAKRIAGELKKLKLI